VAELFSRYLDKTVEVLVEERNPKNINQVMGRTRQGLLVFLMKALMRLGSNLSEESSHWRHYGYTMRHDYKVS
jgi:tRNA A37 methylthiotransferase MiaB